LSGVFHVLYDIDMQKRTIIFGYPAFVVWRSVLAGFLFAIILCGVVVGLMFMALSELLNSINNNAQQGANFSKYWLVMFVLVAVWWWISGRSRRFRRRFKKLNGRVCLACSHAIEEGGEQCSRCGAKWSLEGLSRSWRKIADAIHE
jgi:predicted nucleic acid-binding Zn ribbon protein